jgi:IS5 family transposase
MKRIIVNSLFDEIVYLSEHSTYLDKINNIIDWKPIEVMLESKYRWTKNAHGHPAYSPLILFKILLFQTWEKLSDPQTEFALKDRLSAIRFVGLSITGDVPDHSTISRFRSRLNELGILEDLFLEVNRQLSEKGYMVKEKSSAVIDATIIESSRRPKRMVENIPVDREEEHDDFDDKSNTTKGDNDNSKTNSSESDESSDSSNTTISKMVISSDPDAAFLKKGKKIHYGYKGFASCDSRQFVIGYHCTPANVSEIKELVNFLPKLSLDEGTAIYADKGYASAENRAHLRSMGFIDKIMHKGARGRSLTEEQKMENKVIGKFRGKIERIFGIIKRNQGLFESRFVGLSKVEFEFGLHCIAHNMKKAANMVNLSYSY